jgi:hypothetical protein
MACAFTYGFIVPFFLYVSKSGPLVERGLVSSFLIALIFPSILTAMIQEYIVIPIIEITINFTFSLTHSYHYGPVIHPLYWFLNGLVWMSPAYFFYTRKTSVRVIILFFIILFTGSLVVSRIIGFW